MIRLKNVTKKYKTRTQTKVALNQVSLELGVGIHALLGPNGAGKSTMMKLITCNIMADEGEITWMGEGGELSISKLGGDYRKVLGYAPQQQGLYESFSGYRFLQYMAVLKEIPKSQIDEEVKRVASCVNLSDVLKNRIASYSGGMKQRLLVAQALLGNPKLLIFDEPTVGLDPNERVRIREYIHAMAKEKIVLIATHIVSDVESIADDIIIMKQGQILEKDTKEALCEKYQANNLEEIYMKLFAKEESVKWHDMA